MGWLQSFATELQVTASDGTVWLAIGQGLLGGALCLAFGVWLSRYVGLLRPDAPAAETVGVGLASGVLVASAWWAAVASGGRSAFTPVAVGFVVAIGLALFRQSSLSADASEIAGEPTVPRSRRIAPLVFAALCCAGFVVAIALLYGSTLTLSPRDGVQPIEFNDEAYYSVLGTDLAKTGTETIYSPAGFDVIDGLPVQTWYHWGELWLASAVITVFGTPALAARHFVVLPILLLAAAMLTGTVVRRITGSSSRGAFLFGFLACLFLAPMPLIPGPFFGSFARGAVFWITTYGMASIAVLLALYGLTVLARRHATWSLATFVGSATALILPAHIVIALLGLVGVASAVAIQMWMSLWVRRGPPHVSPSWRRMLTATGVASAITVGWGLLSGHGLAGNVLTSSSASFSAPWRESIAIILACSGVFAAIPIAWFIARSKASLAANLYLGTVALLVAGGTIWGLGFADLNTVHLFFAGIAIFATPVAAIAVWSIWLRLQQVGRVRLGMVGLTFCVGQLGLGAVAGVVRLEDFGPGMYPPVPVEMLSALRNLPTDAKLAYACRPFEEVSFWEGRLSGLDAHVGRRFVPMCFEADTAGQLTETELSANQPTPLFRLAPQHALYPNSTAIPSPGMVAKFLKANGIDYIYADAMHPNTLVPGATPIATIDGVQILRLP